MDRFDGKGYKPQIRPFSPHRKRERAKLKVTKSILPKWQLAMMKLGMNFVAEEDGRIKLCRLTEPDVFETSATTLEEPMCMDMACGEVGDYAMLEAVPSRPPPKHGWARKVLLSAVVFLCKALTLAGIMALANACKKPPVPEPVIPTKEVTIHWNWKANLGWAPPMDTIKYYTDQDDVKFVDINIIGNEGPGFPVNCTGVTPGPFHRARDTLQTRIDIDSTKVRLSGTIVVNSDNGATLQNHDSTQDMGMAYYDSIWFADHGCTVRRPIYTR